VPVDMTAVGTAFDVDVRGRRIRAEVVPEPFYKRAPRPSPSPSPSQSRS
jgi:hypothetical protein